MRCLRDQRHRFVCRTLLQPEGSHGLGQRAGTALQVFCLGNGVFHHLRVLLGDLVQLAYRRADLLQACALFGRRGRNL